MFLSRVLLGLLPRILGSGRACPLEMAAPLLLGSQADTQVGTIGASPCMAFEEEVLLRP